MKGFKFSPMHLPPVKKVTVKRMHYRLLLLAASGVMLVVHYYAPDFESRYGAHLAFAVNLLFIIDPTV